MATGVVEMPGSSPLALSTLVSGPPGGGVTGTAFALDGGAGGGDGFSGSAFSVFGAAFFATARFEELEKLVPEHATKKPAAPAANTKARRLPPVSKRIVSPKD